MFSLRKRRRGRSRAWFSSVTIPTAPGKIVTIQELAYSTEQLLKLVLLSSLNVPEEWIAALGYEQSKHPPEPPTFSPQSPEPKPPCETSWRERRRKQTEPEPQVVELVGGSPFETPISGRLQWLVGVLIFLCIYLLGSNSSFCLAAKHVPDPLVVAANLGQVPVGHT
jgi:hypothetical protein